MDGFSLSCQAVTSQGGRFSSRQNCIAILQSPKKSMEGFFRGKPTPPWRGARSALQSNGVIAEPRNGGDAMLLAVELAKA